METKDRRTRRAGASGRRRGRFLAAGRKVTVTAIPHHHPKSASQQLLQQTSQPVTPTPGSPAAPAETVEPSIESIMAQPGYSGLTLSEARHRSAGAYKALFEAFLELPFESYQTPAYHYLTGRWREAMAVDSVVFRAWCAEQNDQWMKRMESIMAGGHD